MTLKKAHSQPRNRLRHRKFQIEILKVATLTIGFSREKDQLQVYWDSFVHSHSQYQELSSHIQK